MTDTILGNDERNAMRAYIQRAEVRISTMHRITGVFLNGAGLLVLFPVFFRDAISDINGVVLGKIATLYQATAGQSLSSAALLDGLLYLTLFVPFFITLATPIYAFYLLLKDIVYFYFAGHNPGFADKLFNPRFVLAGIAFPSDESPAAKRAVMRHQYSSDLINFIQPFASKESHYYDEVRRQTDGLIIPETRRIEALRAAGVFAPGEAEPNLAEVDRFNTALGLAGFIDRTLVEEVARAEISVVRYALCLRRLIIRYIKALLMFVWTTLISFILVSFLSAVPPLVILALCYAVWGALTPRIVNLPTQWIWQESPQGDVERVAKDEQLIKFERQVTFLCRIALGVSLTALLVELARMAL